MKKEAVIAVVVSAVVTGGTVAAAGPASFGPQTTRRARETPQVSADVPRAIVIGRAGKPIIAGLSLKGGRSTWAVARYRSDGRLDPTFGSGGRLLTEFGTDVTTLAMQTDGKLLVAGAGDVGQRGRSGFVLARFTSRGQFDTSFGSHGVARTAFALIPGDRYSLTRVITVATEPDGKIVAVGWRGGIGSRDFALARYTTRGRLDPSFGSSGRVVTDFGSAPSHQAQTMAAALQPDGKIVVLGTLSLPGYSANVLARFTTRGDLDTSFGEDGRVLTRAGYVGTEARVVVVQPDGKIVVGGGADADVGGHFALLRYMPDGTPDSSFGTGGEVKTEVDPSHPCDPTQGPCLAEAVNSLVIERDGTLLAGGQGRSPGFALARYTRDGSTDRSFGSGGTVLTDFPTGGHLRAIALQADGRILAAGSSHGDFVVARFTQSGSLDPSFGRGGSLMTPFGPLWPTKLISLSAARVDRGIVVRWRTASEFDAARFYVKRETRASSVRVNRSPIWPKGPGGRGASYSFVDRAAPKSTVRYWVQEVTVDRNVRELGQAKVRP